MTNLEIKTFLIIENIKKILGEIDLVPHSYSNFPNIPAKIHYTKKDNALSKDWKRKIYINPPYGKGKEIGKWINHLCEQYEKGNIQEAIALVPCRTDTSWFRRLKKYPSCYIWGRLKFSDSGQSAPFPSMITYLGNNVNRFVEVFSNIGDIYELIKGGQ